MAIPLSRRLDFSEIPQIDVGALLVGDSDEGLINDLERACTDVGFFYCCFDHNAIFVLLSSFVVVMLLPLIFIIL